MDNISILFQAPELALQLAIDGLLIGSMFALAAYGMALVWGVMNIINIAQGEYVTLGGFVAVYAAQAGFDPLYVGVPLAAVLLFLLGLASYRLVIFRLVDRDLFVSLLATFGISIFLQQIMNEIFGADVRTADSGMSSVVLMDGMIVIGAVKIVAFVATLVVGALLYAFLKHSKLGQAIRATSQNARAARILGVHTDRIYATTFGLNAAICGAVGALVAMTWFIHPFAGLPYTVRSFMVVIVAGLGNLLGVIGAAFGLGVAENYAGFILGAEYQNAFVFMALVAILVWRNFRLARKRLYLQ